MASAKLWAAFLIMCLFTLTGATCQTKEPHERIVYQTITVKEEVPVICKVSLPEEPKWEIDSQTDLNSLLKKDVFEKTTIVLQELEQYRGYQPLLEAALKACISP